MRELSHLSGIGKAMLGDFQLLGVRSLSDLARQDPLELYQRLCTETGQRQDPCVYDTFRCAIEQARNPDLEASKRQWWYWSSVRKSEGLVL